MRTVIRLVLAVWLLQWLAGELAAYLGRHPRRADSQQS